MRIFVTGATGVVGRRLVPALLAGGHRVSAVGRTPEARAALERTGARAVAVELLDGAAVRRAVEGHDAVVNLATHIPSPGRMLLPGAWRENDRLRREASAHLADAALAAGAARLVQESFAGIHADAGAAWIDERSPLRPARHTRSTLDAERAAARFASAGRSGVVLRFGMFYGPDTEHLQLFVRAARLGWAALPGAPDAFVSSVSHDDAAAAVVAALALPSGIYAVVDDEPVRRLDFFAALSAAVGVPPPRFPPRWAAHLAGSPGETMARSLRISHHKLREASAWAPRFPSVREGLPATLSALRERATDPAPRPGWRSASGERR